MHPSIAFQIKNSRFKFCFLHTLGRNRIFKILASTPHNTNLIMGGRDKNSKDPSFSDKYMIKAKGPKSKDHEFFVVVEHTLIQLVMKN